MQSKCRFKSEKPIRQCLKNETKCVICENTVFRVHRITSELVKLTCENCGESNMVGITSDKSGNRLTFWSKKRIEE